jgi:hypothetical protein
MLARAQAHVVHLEHKRKTPLLPVCTSDMLHVFIRSVIHTWVSTPYIWSVLTSYTDLDRHRVRFELNPGRLLGLVVWVYVLDHGVQYLEVNPQQAYNVVGTRRVGRW